MKKTHTKDILQKYLKLSQEILPVLRYIAEDYDGKLNVLRAIHDDLIAEKRQVLECDESDGKHQKRLAELNMIERRLERNIIPIEQIQGSLSKYIESLALIINGNK